MHLGLPMNHFAARKKIEIQEKIPKAKKVYQVYPIHCQVTH